MDQVAIHELLPFEQPGSRLIMRHIRHDRDAFMPGTMIEIPDHSGYCRNDFIEEFLRIDGAAFIHHQVIQGK